MNLYRDYLLNTKKSIYKIAHYFPVYERHFSRFVGKSIFVLEIGVCYGGSLQMWKRYFGPFATIVGIDINPKCKKHEEAQIHVRVGDQSDTVFLQSIIDEFGTPDIVVDDGSHIQEHVCKTFDFLYDKMDEDGVYLIEDLHTAYIDRGIYQGGLKRNGTFIERCKKLACDLQSLGQENDFAKATLSISLYEGMAVFEKRRYINLTETSYYIHNQHLGSCASQPVVLSMLKEDFGINWEKYLGSSARVVKNREALERESFVDIIIDNEMGGGWT